MRNWNTNLPRSFSIVSSFQTTYEELKLTFDGQTLLRKFASRLPMRNWNLTRQCTNIYWACMASRLPMRNWNRHRPYRHMSGNQASRLPMRNWNFYHSSRSRKQRSLPDYLWGIETRSVNGWFVSSFCFQTTYEELKLSRTSSRISTMTGFQTTYEELKLMQSGWLSWKSLLASRLPMRNWNLPARKVRSNIERASRLPMRNWNPHSASANSRMILASRLPMRNWNVPIAPQSPAVGLPDYLWGIETFASGNLDFQLEALPDYLWGIETLCRDIPGWHALASRLPMRNWNASIAFATSLKSARFQTTYEELKHLFRVVFTDHDLGLPDYLWGIETLLFPSTAIWAVASRLPMRNWNSWPRVPNPRIRGGFQTTYEELKL